MQTALVIMMLQGLLGAWDTLYYHELVCRLPAHARVVAGELRLHALRDLVYGVLFLSLPFLTWQGMLAGALVGLIALEVCITIQDFNTEAVERQPIGGVGNTERGLHLIMAVVYGFFLAHLAPQVFAWSRLPTGFGLQEGVSWPVRSGCVFLGIGVLVSGARDFGAALGVRWLQQDLFGRRPPQG